MKIKALAALSAAALAIDVPAYCAPADATAVGSEAAPLQDTDGHIPIKTIVQIEITQAISSKTNVIGDTFALRLAAPLSIDGRAILSAGLVGRGEVTHAAKSGWGGRAGELIVNARYLECGDLRIPLGHFHMALSGKDNVAGAFATAQVIPLGQFIVSGHDAWVPAGTRGTAQVNADVIVPAGTIKACMHQTG